MTRSIVMVAVVAIALAVAVSGCGKDGGNADPTTTIAPATTTTIAPTTTTTLPDVVDWSEAAQYVGTQATITGTVVSCDANGDRVYIPLSPDNTDPDFDIWIDLNPDGTVPFAGITAEELPGFFVGKTVEITGTVVSAGPSSYGIFLTDMSQVVVK